MEPKSDEKRPAARTTGTLVSPPGMPKGPVADQDDQLRSWKDIATFLACDERTARRWEELGMPVHRIPRAKRSRISASRAELSQWLATQHDVPPEVLVPPERPKTSTRRYGIAGTVICILGLLAALVVMRGNFEPPVPARVAFTEEAVVAFDAAGHRLWEHNYHRRLQAVSANRSLSHLARIADLMGNGDRQVLVGVWLQSGPNPQNLYDTEVDCFSSNGKLLWSYAPHESFRFGDYELRGPWYLFEILVGQQGPHHSIWAAFNHENWGNTIVVQIAPANGHGTVRFVNTGKIRELLELHAAGTSYLLAGGFNNEHDGASLAVIDERKSFAASPQTAGTRHKCVSCPGGGPDYYFVFPRSEINRERKAYEHPVRSLAVNGNEVEVATGETPDYDLQDVRVYHRLRFDPPTIQRISLRYGSTYELLHRDLEHSGELKHSLETCPERLHPLPVKMWTPVQGWTELTIKPNHFEQ